MSNQSKKKVAAAPEVVAEPPVDDHRTSVKAAKANLKQAKTAVKIAKKAAIQAKKEFKELKKSPPKKKGKAGK